LVFITRFINERKITLTLTLPTYFFIIEQETLASFLDKKADFFSNTEKGLNDTIKPECSTPTPPQR
jgi:hypothetical protein